MKHFENKTIKVLILTCLFFKLAQGSDVFQIIKEAITADFLNKTFYIKDESENSEVIEIPNGDENQKIVKNNEKSHDNIKIKYSDNNKNIELTVYGYDSIALKIDYVEDKNEIKITMSLEERSSKIIFPVIKLDKMDNNLRQLVIYQIKSSFVHLFENYYYNIVFLKELEIKQNNFKQEEEDDCFEQFINLIYNVNKNKSSKDTSSNSRGIEKKGSNKNYFIIPFDGVLKEHFSKKTTDEFKYIIVYNDLINGKIFIKSSIPEGPDEYRYLDYNKIFDFFISSKIPFIPINPEINHIFTEYNFGNGSKDITEEIIIPELINDTLKESESNIDSVENISELENDNIGFLDIFKNIGKKIISIINNNDSEIINNLPESPSIIPKIFSRNSNIDGNNKINEVKSEIKIVTPCLLI